MKTKKNLSDQKVKLAERDKAQKEYDEVKPYVPTMQQLQQEFKNPAMKKKLAEFLQNVEIQKKIQNREFNMTIENYRQLQQFMEVMNMAKT